MSYLFWLIPLVGYLGIAKISTFFALKELGRKLRKEGNGYPQSEQWRQHYIVSAREDLAMAWFWPFYVVRWFLSGILGDFFKGLGAFLRGKP